MATFEYTVSCIYCEHFQYSPDTIEINPWKEELCAITYKKHSPNDIICDFFKFSAKNNTLFVLGFLYIKGKINQYY